MVATAKRDLRAGELLDGEGGYTVYGKLMPASDSLVLGGLPLGLAHGVKLVRAVAARQPVKWSDVESDASGTAVRFRREMERMEPRQSTAANKSSSAAATAPGMP